MAARRVLAGLGSLLVLAVVIVGIPLFLVVVVGNPLPTAAQWNAIATLQPDYGNEILLTKALPCIAWLAWALFAIPWLIELFTRAAGRPVRRPPLVFRGQQRMAAVLIGAVLVMFASGAGVLGAASPAQAAPTTATVQHSQQFEQARELAEQQAIAAAQAAQQQEQEQASAPVQHSDLDQVVQPGDTLWGLAQSHLGDGNDYPEIFQASTGIDQPGGRHITNPNLIYPGEHVIIPGAGAEITPPAPAPAPAPAAPATPDTAAAPAAPAAAPTAPDAATPAPAASQQTQASGGTQSEHGSRQAPSSAHQDPELTESDFSIPLATTGAVGGVLAAGLLVALGLRRLRQRRRRQPGERIAMPEQEAADYELELRMVESPLVVADLDNALRSLQVWAEDTGSALPELLAVRVAGDEIALYLTGPADLPAPFESVAPDKTAWVIRPGVPIQPSREAVSPYPALTTIGTDAHGGVIMLDLEQIGSLNIEAEDEETARGMLTAMSVELASNPWSEGARITLVGIPVTIAREVDRYRIQHVDDVAALVRNLRSDLDDRRDALDSYNATDVHDARAHAAEFETWAPHIVILAEEPSSELGAELAKLVARMPRLGIATIAHGAPINAAATITVADAKHAEYVSSSDALPPLPFEPQLLVGRELELVQALFDTTEQASHPADLVTQAHIVEIAAQDATVDEDANSDDQLADAVDGDRWALILPPSLAERSTRAAAEPEADAVDAAKEANAVDAAEEANAVDAAEEAEEASEPSATSPVDLEPSAAEAVPAAAADAAAEINAEAPTPHAEPAHEKETATDTGLGVHAPDWPAPYIRLLGPIDALNLADADAMPGRGVELLAYLALQSGPVPGAQVQKAMWPDKYDPKNNNLRTLAKQVRSTLGNAPDGTPLLPEGRNSVGFTIHPEFRTDWQDFCELIGPDLKATSNENLIAAIRLVRGTPFTGANRRRGWWGWRAPAEEEMIAQILDAADELGDRALRRGDYDQARFAAHIAQAADPLNEAGWRLELRAAMKAGDVDEFNRIVDDLYARVGGTDPNYVLDETTQELVDSGPGGANTPARLR